MFLKASLCKILFERIICFETAFSLICKCIIANISITTILFAFEQKDESGGEPRRHCRFHPLRLAGGKGSPGGGIPALSVSFFGKGDFYALRASGSSMVDAQIDDGDLVIIRQQHTAQVGEIVVALTDEDKNTLKRLLYDDDRQSYYLHPENKDMEDIYVSGLRVQGVATHVIKAL